MVQFGIAHYVLSAHWGTLRALGDRPGTTDGPVAIRSLVRTLGHPLRLRQCDPSIMGDPLERMRVYQLAKELLEPAFADAEVLRAHPITTEIARQLYTAVGSITANIREGYYRSSGKDRARIFEYALGSAGESEEWYDAGEPVLVSERTECRRKTLREIQRMLKAIIPRERDRLIRPHRPPV